MSRTPTVNLALVIGTLSGGGAERVLELLATGLDPQRFDVTIVELKGSGEKAVGLRAKGYPVVSFVPDGNARRSYLNCWRLRKLVQRRRIDLIHSHSPSALADAALCRLLVPHLRLVHTFHYGNYPHLDATSMRIERWGHRLLDARVAVGYRQAETICETYGIPAARMNVIWNGIEVRSPRVDQELLAPYLGKGRVVIGTVGTLFEQKGHVDLLDVAAVLKARGLQVTFLVVGAGPLWQALNDRCEAMGLSDYVKFLGWVKDAADRVMGAIDVFFQPSRWEAMSVVLLEAAAAGKPIVCTDVGEASRLLLHEESALITKPRDVAAMADALQRVVENADLRRRLGSAAQRIVERECRTTAMVAQYERLYLTLCGDRSAEIQAAADVGQMAR
jgi:glycosyltransferase involved in cell wall biosynthesis